MDFDCLLSLQGFWFRRLDFRWLLLLYRKYFYKRWVSQFVRYSGFIVSGDSRKIKELKEEDEGKEEGSEGKEDKEKKVCRSGR